MDESFFPLHSVIEGLKPTPSEFFDDDEGVHSFIDKIEIDMPVELSITVDSNGTVIIGTTPPLYYVDTTYRPSYHQIRFVAEKNNEDYGE
jgi:hypothetical protein